TFSPWRSSFRLTGWTCVRNGLQGATLSRSSWGVTFPCGARALDRRKPCPYRISRPRSIYELPLVSDATSRFPLAAPTTAPLGIRERETMMAEERKPIAETVTREIVGGIKGVGDIANALVDTVSGSLVKLIKGTGAVGTTLTSTLADVVRGAIQGTSQVG